MPRTEQLTPGILYVGIATLTGSILARSRTLPTRLLLPPTLFIFSMNIFLPQTSHNLSAYLTSLEEAYFPNVAEKHKIANAHTQMTWERMKEGVHSGREKTDSVMEALVGRVQGWTGLKLRETAGEEVFAKRADSKVLEAVRVAEKKIAEVTDTAGQTAEVARPAVEAQVEDAKRIV
jgi:organizing structure protein 2